MITTPSMGLTRWDQPNDVFSYTELSSNFNLLDLHDHTAGKGVQVPTGGLANLAVDTTKLNNLAVTDAKIATATVSDAKLASPNNGSWRTLFQANMKTGSTDTTGSVYFPIAGAGSFLSSGSTTATGVNTLVWFPTHYSVAGKTLQFRMTIGGMTNATAPAFNITWNLRPLSSTGGGTGGSLQYVLGTAVTGSDLTFNALAATTSYLSTVTFTPPVQGIYCIGATISANAAANSGSSWTAMVQYAHV